MGRRGAFRAVMTGLFLGLCLLAVGSNALPGFAIEAEAAGTSRVLQVEGAIAGGGTASFDLAALKALPAVTIKTTTPWTDHEDTYVGVRVRDLLDHLGAKGTSVIASAVDDYAVSIPMRDLRDYDVIIAYAMDGKPLPLDDKGPYWIIYPFSAETALQTDIYFSRSVWQLKRLTVE